MAGYVPLSRRLASSGGAWASLAAGPLVGTAINLVNKGSTDTRVSVRVKIGASRYTVLPDVALPASAGEQSARLALVPLPLAAGDAIEVVSEGAVDWTLNGAEVITARQKLAGLVASGDTWTTVVTGPCTVSGLVAANAGMSEASISVRGAGTLIVDGAPLDEGEAGRLTPVITLAATQTLEVKCVGGVDVVVSYVEEAAP